METHKLFISMPTNGSALQSKLTHQNLCIISKDHSISKRIRCFQWSIGYPKSLRRANYPALSFAGSRWEFKGSSRKQSSCCATRNGDAGPNEDSPEDRNETNKPGSSNAGDQFGIKDSDWRTFRARLVISEQIFKIESGESGNATQSPAPLGSKWAHPISVPESGCVLVATKKLDNIEHFQRTVVLLLKVGSNDLGEVPFGVILNRPLQKCIKDMKPPNPDLATIFGDCPLYFGGPLEPSVFVLATGEKVFSDFEEVIPGLYYGARNTLHLAAELVRNKVLQHQNFRFFLGYSAWGLNQLRNEIAEDYWYVAACSPNLIATASASSSGLWEEILQLMGGQYAEHGRKSTEDNL